MIKIKTQIKDTLQINKLLKSVNDKYIAKIGILGSDATNTYEDSANTTAQIGRQHEFGSISQNIPQRSFLIMPINKNILKIKQVGFNTLKDGIKNKSIDIKKTMINMAVKALEFSTQAFFTNGFGTWKPLSRQTIEKKKGNDKPLIDTRQLLRSRTFKVDKIK
jgi:hypothetical protein